MSCPVYVLLLMTFCACSCTVVLHRRALLAAQGFREDNFFPGLAHLSQMSIEVLENSFESSATATSIGQEPAHAPLERIPPQPGLVLFRGRQANSPIYVEGRGGFGKNSKQAKLELDDVLQTLLQHGVENTRDEAESVSGTSGDSKRLPKGLAKGKRKTRRRKADRRRRRGRRRKEL